MEQNTWVRDQLEIRSLIERYSDACCQRDSKALMELWADDCRWSVPDMEGLENVQGKQAIETTWKGAQALFPVSFVVCVPGIIEIDGDTAMARTYTTEVLESAEGEVRHAVGRYDDKFAKRDGRWLFVERVWHMLYHL